MKDFTFRFTATALPAGVSIKEVITNGNLLLASAAAIIAFLSGVWAYRKHKTEAMTAKINQEIAEMTLKRLKDGAS
jgi:hypothetical protein